MCRCVVVPTWNSTNSIESFISGWGYATRPSLLWNCLSLRGTVCNVMCIYILVDISNVASSCFKSNRSGRQKAAFILLICILLILLLIFSTRRCSSTDTCTFAAATAAAAVVVVVVLCLKYNFTRGNLYYESSKNYS